MRYEWATDRRRKPPDTNGLWILRPRTRTKVHRSQLAAKIELPPGFQAPFASLKDFRAVPETHAGVIHHVVGRGNVGRGSRRGIGVAEL